LASVKKSNIFPWRKSAEYLSDMSEKGLHIQKIGVFKNIFEKDGGKRYIYISVPKTQGETLPENWEFLTERKKICYYRKKINSGCVCEKRRFSFKKLESEVEWLEEKSKGKMLLCGRCGKEYIFEKVKRGREIEYDIECVKNSESRSEIIEKMTSEGWYYTAFSENGDKLYFARKKDGAKENQRRKLLTALWASMLVAVASVVTFIAMGIYTAVTVYKNVISDCDAMPQVYLFLIVTAACVGAFISGVTAFKRISVANAKEAQEDESAENPESVEAAIQNAATTENEAVASEDTENDDGFASSETENPVESNAVEEASQTDENGTFEVAEEDSEGEESSALLNEKAEEEITEKENEYDKNSAKRKKQRQLLLYWFIIVLDVICFWQSVRFCYRFLWLDEHRYHALLIVAFLVIGFSPLILYSAIGALSDRMRSKDKE